MDTREEQFEDLRDSLEVELHTLEEELAGHGKIRGETGDWEGNSGGLEGIEPDSTDTADQIEELVTNVPLVEELERQHKDVSHALKKMDEGTYGTCETCGSDIPFERLQANPAARFCMKHAEGK